MRRRTAIDKAPQAKPGRPQVAFGVHVLTASGTALCLLALIAAINGQWSLMFVWLGLALIIDGVDGSFARLLHVSELLPRWSGDTLDLVVDFLNYVFVPAYAIVSGGLLPQSVSIPAGITILLTSALYFADRRMKTKDNYFRGFPALWNFVAFYLFLLRPAPWLSVMIIAVLSVLTFVPYPFIHPLRVLRFRALNIIMLIAWAILAVIAVIHNLTPGPLVTGGLSALAVWFVASGLLRRPA
jgi:phosphatidylcholine synthase